MQGIYNNIQSSFLYVQAVDSHRLGEHVKHVKVNYFNQLWIEIKLC